MSDFVTGCWVVRVRVHYGANLGVQWCRCSAARVLDRRMSYALVDAPTDVVQDAIQHASEDPLFEAILGTRDYYLNTLYAELTRRSEISEAAAALTAAPESELT